MLAGALRARGHRALRININGGDKVDWPGEGATDYRGTFRNWPIFFDDHIVHHGVTDLILYGDCRPYHASAHKMARLRNLRVPEIGTDACRERGVQYVSISVGAVTLKNKKI